MQVGIAGFRGCGKTTVFNCLTGAEATTGYGGSREANRGVIKVPDERIDALSDIFNPKKTTFADVTFVDVPGGDDSGLDTQGAAELRTMDALVHVMRGFADDGVPARNDKVDAVRDLIDFDLELSLLDTMVIIKGVHRGREMTARKARHWEALIKGFERPPGVVIALLQSGDPRSQSW